MTRQEWLLKRHVELDNQIKSLEAEREVTRNFNHKSLLIQLKKQKLMLKTELNLLS
jgi:uncharacterized protein YdcH (DUF465 family)